MTKSGTGVLTFSFCLVCGNEPDERRERERERERETETEREKETEKREIYKNYNSGITSSSTVTVDFAVVL